MEESSRTSSWQTTVQTIITGKNSLTVILLNRMDVQRDITEHAWTQSEVF
jgi:hypothetical protein